jgi:excisionase family DNA binding protein
MNETQGLLTITEFAEKLRVTPACIRRWVLERRVISIKIGRCVRIPREEAQRIVDAGVRPVCSAHKPTRRESR